MGFDLIASQCLRSTKLYTLNTLLTEEVEQATKGFCVHADSLRFKCGRHNCNITDRRYWYDGGDVDFQWCNSSMKCATPECVVSTQSECPDSCLYEPELKLTTRTLRWTLSIFSDVPRGRKDMFWASCYTTVSPPINHRPLILSEWLWGYLETPFLLLEVKPGAVVITGAKSMRMAWCFYDLCTNLPHCFIKWVYLQWFKKKSAPLLFL